MRKWYSNLLSLTVAISLGVGTIFGGGSEVLAATGNSHPYVDEIMEMQTHWKTADELVKEAERIAKMDNMEVEQVLKQIHDELKRDKELAEKEREELGLEPNGGNNEGIPVGNSKRGDIYYTPSSTAYLDHGHVGMYYKSKGIVESIPKKGVRTISTKQRKVDKKGAVVRRVKKKYASKNQKKKAANWAKSRVGKDKYSYNFATNRKTSHYGKKNCSKLIWSAYLLKADTDIDKDKGTGVYPRDIRDAKQVKHVRKITG